MSRALKLYAAYSWPLSGLPNRYRAANGSTQVGVLIRCATKRRFAELLSSYYHPANPRDINSALRHLSTYCLCQTIEPDHPRYAVLDAVAVKPETVYYNPETHCSKLGYVNQWFELPPYQP